MTNNNQQVLNYMKAVEKYLEGFKDIKAVSGILDSASQDVKDKAKWNEYGTHHILKYDSVAIEGEGLKPINAINFDRGDLVLAGSDISIPARPFIRLNLYEETGERMKESLEHDLTTMLRFHSRLADNPTKATVRTMQNMGNKAMVLQRQKASLGGFEPSVNKTNKDQENNSPLTIKIKGFNHPLFETGEMVSSISSEVTRRNR